MAGVTASKKRGPAGHPESFYTEVIVDTIGNALKFELDQAGEVDWGDGVFVGFVANTPISDTTLNPGPVVIKSVNNPTKVLFDTVTPSVNYKEINIINSSTLTDLASIANQHNHLTTFAMSDASNVTTCAGGWSGNQLLTSFSVGNLDMSSCTIATGAWSDCPLLTSFPALNMSSIETISNAWRDCIGLLTFPLIDFSSTTATPGAIIGDFAWETCSSLTTFPAINFSDFDDLTKAFEFNVNLASVGAINTTGVTLFNRMFNGCSALVCLSTLDTTSQTDTTSLFFGCSSLVAPNGTEQTALLAGSNYVNGGACP